MSQSDERAEYPRANEDTEAMLQELAELIELRRKDPELERRYKWLRDRLAPLLAADGPRLYVDINGRKFIATATSPEKIQISVLRLKELHDAGDISDEIYEHLCPRKPSAEMLEKYYKEGYLTREQFLYVSRPMPSTQYVTTSAVDDDNEAP